MIIEIENNGNTIGSLKVVENNENGEVEVKEINGEISIADVNCDETPENDEKIRVNLNTKGIKNLIDIGITYGYYLGTTDSPIEMEDNVVEMIDTFCANGFCFLNKNKDDL